VVPAALVLLGLAIFSQSLTGHFLAPALPDGVRGLEPAAREAYLSRAAEFAGLAGAVSGGDALFDAVVAAWRHVGAQVRLSGFGLAALMGVAGMAVAWWRLRPDFRARSKVEGAVQFVLMLCAGVAVVTTLGIVLSLVFEAFRFFQLVDPLSFLFGTRWDAQENGVFGALPLFFGTFLIALIAMVVAVPVGLYSAIYLSEYATPGVRAWAKPILEVLAGIPTVVYGFFAVMVVAPLIRSGALWINEMLMHLPFVTGPVLDAQPTSALAAGLVMGVMIIPFVSSLSDDVINAVPQSLRDGSYAVGATKSETIRQVVLPAALPGVIAAIMLAVSRAIGETMIVAMAAGERAQITADVTSDITTITKTIVSLLTGDSDFGSAKVLSAFALGFVLFLVTLMFNMIAIQVVKKYREKYD
jgi:phosphate transport system permease protein